MLSRRLAASEALRCDPNDAAIARIRMNVRPQLRGGRTFMAGAPPQTGGRLRPDAVMLKGVRSAHALLERLDAQPWKSPADLTAARAPGDSYERRLIGVALLAPDIQAAILEGRQAAGLKLANMTRRDLPLAWADQRALLGFAPA